MSDIVDTPEQAAAQALPPLVVREPLEALLDAHGLGSGPAELEPIGEGHSNVTYLVCREGARVVLRRPPRPPLPPSSHDVVREARILRGLEGTDARVPRILLVCDDAAVIGAPFYVMEHVEGDVISDRVPERFGTPEARRAIADELVDALVEVHGVDWAAGGLGAIARPSGYLERQVRRFTSLWEHNKTREVPDVDRVSEWLAAHLPPSPGTTVVHGDFRLGNTMFAPGPRPRVAAIFDWELATLGDPLADVGYLVANWPQGDEPDDVMTELSAVVRSEGFPSREELIARYEERSGRNVTAVGWYETLAIWKAAVFLEGSYARYVAGRDSDPFFAALRDGVPALAARARRVAGAAAG